MTKYILFKVLLEFEEAADPAERLWMSPLIENSHHLQRVYDQLKEKGFELLPDSFAIREENYQLFATGKAIPITNVVGRSRSFGGFKAKHPVKINHQ